MGFKGSVESFSLADVFQNLAMNQQTGTLRVLAADGEEKLVYFQNGNVKYLSRGPRVPLLPPEVFHARGLILKNQLDEAIRHHSKSGQHVGTSLIELGHINQQQLDEVTRHQIEEEIYDLFGWEKAQFEFNEGAPADGLFADQISSAPATPHSLPISHLIMEAARRVDEWDRLRGQIPNFKEIYTMDVNARKAIEKGETEVDAVEKRVAKLIDGARDVEDLIFDSYLFKFEVLTALAGFLQSSSVHPANVQQLLFSEQECLKENLPKRRIKVLERILAQGGENPRVRKELAELLAKESQVERACIHFCVLAEVEQQAKKTEEAIDLYRRILSISPKHVKAHEQLGSIYAKRGQKREAYVHYHELFESFRDQNHPREARTAAVCALECDPSQTELRNSLVELLISANEKEAASQQLEILGDQAAKLGNIKLAVDSYRRAMQYRPANKQLKKKLADVMLTKEDRAARKRNALLVMIIFIVVAIAAGVLGYKEYMNSTSLTDVNRRARKLIDDAEENQKREDYLAASTNYEEASRLYASLENVFSPVFRVNQKSHKQVIELKALVESMKSKSIDVAQKGQHDGKAELEQADSSKDQKDYENALKHYEAVLANAHTPDELMKQAESGKQEVKEKIAKFDSAMQRMAKSSDEEFPSVEEEDRFKRKLIEEFTGYSKLHPEDVLLPLWVKPNCDNVNVFIDGQLKGSANENANRKSNTFHYPFRDSAHPDGKHQFEFKKAGFRSLHLTNADLTTPVLKVTMEREPIVKINLPEGVAVSGIPAFEGGYFYIGTSDGALYQLSETNTAPKTFKLPEGTNQDVYGPIMVYSRGAKSPIVVFTTRAGECVGITSNGESFTRAWPSASIKDPGLNIRPRPAIMSIASKTSLVIPFEKTLYKLDCETGLLVPMPAFDATIKSSAWVTPKSSVIAGGDDGFLYGINTKGLVEKWSTGAGAATSLTGQPTIADGQIVVGANDGKLYFFDPGSPSSKIGEVQLKGEIVSQPLVWNRRLYVGTTSSDSLWCVDAVTRSVRWPRVDDPPPGGISFTPAVLDNWMYFVTDGGKLFSIDADKGNTRWMFQIDSAKGFAGPPIISGRRVYVVTRDGRILGFDEPKE